MGKMRGDSMEHLPSLTKAEREIYLYLLGKNNLNMTIRELSEILGYSTTTIFRLSQKLGFEGYIDMINNLCNHKAISNVVQSPPTQKTESNRMLKYQELEHTNKMLENSTLIQLSKEILSFQTYFLTSHDNKFIFDYFQKSLLTINLKSIVYNDVDIFLGMLERMTERSFLFLDLTCLNTKEAMQIFSKTSRSKQKIAAFVSEKDIIYTDYIDYPIIIFDYHVGENVNVLPKVFVFEIIFEYLINYGDNYSSQGSNCDILDDILEMLSTDSFLTLETISERVYHSPSTITKVCQSYGFQGFYDFQGYVQKRSYAVDCVNEYKNMNVIRDRKWLTTKRHFFESLNQTTDYLHELLSETNVINIVGRGLSAYPAIYFQKKMIKHEKLTIFHTDIDLTNYAIKNMGEDEIFVIFSLSSSSEHISKFIEIAIENKVKTILITSREDLQLPDFVQVYFYEERYHFDNHIYQKSRLRLFIWADFCY